MQDIPAIGVAEGTRLLVGAGTGVASAAGARCTNAPTPALLPRSNFRSCGGAGRRAVDEIAAAACCGKVRQVLLLQLFWLQRPQRILRAAHRRARLHARIE